ncbi:Cof-type HAD-IIB family hydrolase [Faecalispora anaeroviscerum]|uniref:Cof-type HAD-IIB family hydrolase n=1 Tax=Faecalispora anaeroviscerum TaxID=2991836 RepID=UPI0024B90B08|nr:Cof-type HAD-IIB family hydrolase [Faecalispora anaeroviscerum]
MKLQDIFLVSDLDGTLIGENHTIPQRNIEAIQRLQEQGGHFAVATGRSVDSGSRYYRQVQPKGLCVMLNGSILYDYERDEIAKAFFLPPRAKEYARQLAEHFPEMGYEVFTQREFFVLRANPYIKAHLGHESLPCAQVDESIITDGWCKVLFAADPATKLRMHAFTESFAHPGVRFVQSDACFLEMLPEGVDKGSGLIEILRQTGMTRENLVAIGDYYNDVEMLRAAGFAAVPSNAPADIQQMADLVVGDCRDGAVADLIEYLERAE